MKELKYYQDEARKRRELRNKGSEQKPEQKLGQEREKNQNDQQQEEQKSKNDENKDQEEEDPISAFFKQQGKKSGSSTPNIKKIEIKITNRNMLIGLVTAVAVYMVLRGGDQYFYREITWQDFKRDFLDKGIVEKANNCQ